MKSRFEIPDFLQVNKFPSLDGIRAICITLVVFSHVCNAYQFADGTRKIITSTGILGVQIFFVISGFLITTLLLKEKVNTGNISLRFFYLRRVLRIFPVVFLYLACLLLLNIIFHLHIPVKSFIGAALFLANLSYFQSSWYTLHYWSLSIEEQYYLVFPFMLKKCINYIHLLLVIFICFIIFLRALAYSGHFPNWPFLQYIGFLIYQSDGVLMGSLIAILCFKNHIPFAFLQKYCVYLNFLLPVLICVFHFGVIGFDAVNPAITSLFIAVLLLCNTRQHNNPLYRFLNNRHIMFIGKLSFSIYIWQQLFTSTDGKFGKLTHLPLNLLLIFLAAWCSYTFFEKKFLKMKSRYS